MSRALFGMAPYPMRRETMIAVRLPSTLNRVDPGLYAATAAADVLDYQVRPTTDWADRDRRGMTTIRPEGAEDVAAVRVVNERAFGVQTEARLVDTLPKANTATVSLVAQQDDQVVGHILFSPVTVANAPVDVRGVGLAPMSVLPEFQNRGIGSRLVWDGLAACQSAGYDIVVVLGHVDYYPRFGFARAKDFGLENEYEAADSFMVLELNEGALKRISGLVTFAPEFHEAGC